MSFLLDTCVVSELVKPEPEPLVSEWFRAAPPEALFVSVLTLAEIRKGVEKLPHGRRRARIAAWLEIELPFWFEGRVLPVDFAVADEWGRMLARVERPVPVIDGPIAATALSHRLVVVTRDEGGFAPSGVDIVNPWKVWSGRAD